MKGENKPGSQKEFKRRPIDLETVIIVTEGLFAAYSFYDLKQSGLYPSGILTAYMFAVIKIFYLNKALGDVGIKPL